MFNVYNALAAASLAMILGIDQQAIREGLESVVNVPGRVEMLDTKTPYKVILDYSHSPDALENILTTVRTFTRSRLIVLFGCGGDRDHGKRPIMGEIAGRLADFSILTSDNPRTEDPNGHSGSIEEGIKPTGGKYVIIENRREAIRHALEMGREGDVIILAGKGHETYQDIMGVKRPFDEKVVVQELLRELQPESESFRGVRYHAKADSGADPFAGGRAGARAAGDPRAAQARNSVRPVYRAGPQDPQDQAGHAHHGRPDVRG